MIPGVVRRYATSFTGAVLVVALFEAAQYPALSQVGRTRLAARFHFDKQPLSDVPAHPPFRTSYPGVHPSLQRISAWVSAGGAAAALADLDGDGLPNDVVLVDPRTDAVSIAPVPGSGARYRPFALSPAPLPFDPATTGATSALAGDFNEDGLMDVLVPFYGRTPIIYLRRPVGGVLDEHSFVPTELTTSGDRWFSSTALQADFDGDGHIDLLIGNYFQDGARILDANAGGVETMQAGMSNALNGGSKRVFLWQGATGGAAPSVQYREIEGVFRAEVNYAWTLGMGAADLDGDLLPEIYFAHDHGPDRLLHNRSTPGHLRFVELEGRRSFTMPKSFVMGRDSFKGMGCDFADINGDGFLDIYVSNIASKYALTESHFLWQSTGRPEDMQHGISPFVQNSEKLGLSRGGFGWDGRLADFDNDSTLEAILAVGFAKGVVNRWPEVQSLSFGNARIMQNPTLWPSLKPGADLSGHELSAFFVRAPDGRYYDVGRETGFTEPMITRGIAVADVDGDGRLDFVFANQWEPSLLYHNAAPDPGGFLGLHLLLPLDSASAPREVTVRDGHPAADTPGRPAIGASATLMLTDGRKLAAQVDGGSGHSGHRSPDIHFGLGLSAKDHLQTVELRWRDRAGTMRHATLQLLPGWHTVLLGGSGSPSPVPAS